MPQPAFSYQVPGAAADALDIIIFVKGDIKFSIRLSRDELVSLDSSKGCAVSCQKQLMRPHENVRMAIK